MNVPQTEIIVIADGREVARKIVPPGEYIIGREDDCDLLVEVDMVSRRHARLSINYDHALIEDLGSSYGTLVNGRPVTESTHVWPNQKIQVGRATIELHRLKEASIDDSLAPHAALVRKALPEEFLRERKYEIGGVVAQGGMGAILDAKEATTGRTVAMKVMLKAGSSQGVMRFIGEAKVTARLEHPNIVPVHELSVDENDQVFYTMKFVKGVTLREVLERLRAGEEAVVAKYPLSTLLTIYQKMSDAVAFAHSQGVIHRDLKPENVMIGDYGEVLVMDWGLAKVEYDSGEGEGLLTEQDSAYNTMVGQVMGTPQYMSPEQARGEVDRLDARTDIYALGAILYHLLALRAPVSGRNAVEVVDKVGRGEIEPLVKSVADSRSRLSHLQGGRIPESLGAVVRKAMAFDPGRRYRNVEALQADITAYQNGFATNAEHAGATKQFALFIKRHKAVSIATAAGFVLLVCITAAFTARVYQERNAAVAERNRAQLAQADAETERNRAQEALADVETERNLAQKAQADAESERNRAQKALADFESEHKRADTEHLTAENQRTRAEGESGRAEKALAELKKTAPTFYALAKSRFDEGNFSEAIEQIGYAMQLDDTNADYHLFNASVLQVTRKLPEAIAEYRRALALRPGDKIATSRMAVCERLAAENRSSEAGSMLGLVSWWKADGDALDSAGRNHAKLMDGATYGVGKYGQAFLLNGSTAYVVVPGSPAWSFGKDNFTIALWVNFSAMFGEQAFVASDEGVGNFNKWIFKFVPGHLQFQVNGRVQSTLNSGYFGPVMGQWYHVALVRSGSIFHFYANGSEISSENWIGDVPQTSAPLTMGHAEGRFYLSGLLEDVRIYNRSLQPGEIKALAKPQQATPSAPQNAPLHN